MMKKNVSRNKFFLCFRPVVPMDDELVVDSTGAVVVRIKNKKEETEHKSRTTSPENSSVPTKKASNFSRAIKAVLFEIMLVKKVHEGRNLKLTQKLYESKHSSCCMSTDEEIKSNSASLHSSTPKSEPNNNSSGSSSSSKNKNSISQNQEKKKIGIYLVIFVLTVTVLRGKICAIIFTSVWLYFLPRPMSLNSINLVGKRNCKEERA